MKRKKFITIASVGAAAIIVPSIYQIVKRYENLNPIIYPQTLAQFWDKQTIKIIGSKYLLHSPNENNKQILKHLILVDKSINNSNLEKALKDQIKKDFETENIVIINGWILSITEVRQCALFLLTNS